MRSHKSVYHLLKITTPMVAEVFSSEEEYKRALNNILYSKYRKLYKACLNGLGVIIHKKRQIDTEVQEQTNSRLEIYTDGGASKQRGGWAFVIYQDAKEIFSKSGKDYPTTNNRMELTAIIEALRYMDQIRNVIPITIKTDSQYASKGIKGWIKGWKKNGWKTSDNNDVKESRFMEGT